jgi:dipeptidyl aminopeptidase/acylaminoacyl peptidase
MNDFPGRIDHDASDSPESSLIGRPIQSAPDLCANASPIHWASEGDAPMLIMHGTADKLVAFDQSVQLDKKLNAVSVPVWFVPVQDGGHGFSGPQVDARVDAFLDRIIYQNTSRQINEAPVRSLR